MFQISNLDPDAVLALIRCVTGIIYLPATSPDKPSILITDDPSARGPVEQTILRIPLKPSVGNLKAVEIGPDEFQLSHNPFEDMTKVLTGGNPRMVTGLPKDLIHASGSHWLDDTLQDLVSLISSIAPNSSVAIKANQFPNGKSSGLVLSHDVDYVNTTFRYRLTRPYYGLFGRAPTLSKRLTTTLKSMSADRVWTHLADARIEAERGIGSTWFFFARNAGNSKRLRSRMFNPTYKLKSEVTQQMFEAIGEKAEIGIHASPEAGENPSLLQSEIDLLQAAAQAPIVGIRHHMGRFFWPNAALSWPSELFDSSFIQNNYDLSTFGTDMPIPIRANGRVLFAHSPSWLDTVAHNFEGKGPREILDDLEGRFALATSQGTATSVVWHGIPLGEGTNVYREILETALGFGMHVGPISEFAAQAAKLFNTSVSEENGELRISSALDESDFELLPT